jgi:hypothetical protein
MKSVIPDVSLVYTVYLMLPLYDLDFGNILDASESYE